MSPGAVTYGAGTVDDPWILKTPSLSSDYKAWRDESRTPPAGVVQVGTTVLSYRIECLDDLAAMLAARGDWMLLGNADEGKPVQPDTVEAWARDPGNPAAPEVHLPFVTALEQLRDQPDRRGNSK